MSQILKSSKLNSVCYDIRGAVHKEARRLEEEGHRILKLNIGNPGAFGFNVPEEIVKDIITNLPKSQGYCESKGIFSARKAIVLDYQNLGVKNIDVENIYIGNGVSELIVMAMQALLNDEDEVLIPSPDYPLWTAAVNLSGGKAVHYRCDENANWFPDINDMKKKISKRTRAIVLINPNNPTGAVYSKVMLGTLYWKLTAQNKNNPTDNFSSSIFKVTYNQKVPPLPVFPLQNDLVQLKELNAPLDFKWNVLNTFENITLEVYTAENLKTPLFTESVANQTYLETRKISKAGKYYWKLKGKMSGSEGILESPMQNFQVIIGEELQSPLPLSPEDQNIFYISNNEESNFKNLRLTWKNNPEANQYLVTIKRNDSSKEFRVPLNEFLAPAMGKGNYSWSVQSINAKNEVSKKINLRHFTISGMEGINFKNFKKEVYYYNELPVYNFSWNQVPGVLSYRLKISQRAGFENAEILKVKDPSFNYQVGKEGFYYVLVEGLNLNDIVMAQSEVTSFQVAKSPTPKTPLFLEANQKVIEATPNGDINFNLVNYQDTYLTQIEIKDNNGNVIEVSKNKSAKANFSGLQPGSFYAVAKFFDEHGQGSEYSERKKFIVPDKSAIAPPSARGVRVR
jgi:hypothetical protein